MAEEKETGKETEKRIGLSHFLPIANGMQTQAKLWDLHLLSLAALVSLWQKKISSG